MRRRMFFRSRTSPNPVPRSPAPPWLHAISIRLSSDSRSSSLEADTPIQLCDWELYLRETAQKILQEQSPTRLLEVRGRLYELLTHCIPPDVILKARRTIIWTQYNHLEARRRIE